MWSDTLQKASRYQRWRQNKYKHTRSSKPWQRSCRKGGMLYSEERLWILRWGLNPGSTTSWLWPQASYVTPQSLSLFEDKVETMITTSKVCHKDQVKWCMESPLAWPQSKCSEEGTSNYLLKCKLNLPPSKHFQRDANGVSSSWVAVEVWMWSVPQRPMC
jgi:hypothetical protein